jgi:hypothetical protein
MNLTDLTIFLLSGAEQTKVDRQRSTTVGKANRQRRRMKEKERKRTTPRNSGETWPASDRLPIEERAALDVATALRALAYDDRRAFAAASARVADQSRSASSRSATERLLADYLQSVVSGAWHRGWQPADLVRVVSHQLSKRHVSLAGDAIAAQMQHYIPSTIDPRWTSQLSDLAAQVWWRPGQNHLQAWAEAQTMEWSTVVSCALEVLDLIAGLPDLEKLIPIPGSARPTGATAQPQRAAIDERVLSRIRALLAKAESSTFPAEAETFTAGAQALMARHSIDHALLAALDQSSSEEPTGRRIGIENPYEEPKAMLLGVVAEANRCRTVWSRDLGFSTAIGFPADLDAVELLFTSLLVQATTAMMHAGSRTDGSGRSRTRSFRQSFLTAYASRIGQRLAETTGTETTKAATEPAGRNLLPVLAARSEAVDEAVATMFPEMTNHVVGSVTNREGWFSGLSAADRAALHIGDELLG